MSKMYFWLLMAFLFMAAGIGQQAFQSDPTQNIYNTTDTKFNVTTCYTELTNATGFEGVVCGITTTVQESIKTMVEYGFNNPGLNFNSFSLLMIFSLLAYFAVFGIVIIYLIYIALRNWKKQKEQNK